MTVADSTTVGHNKTATRWSGRRSVTEQSAPGGAPCVSSSGPHLARPLGRGKRGVPCPMQTFTSDRQRMLRSWLALQGAAPAHILADELVATISALRQLMEVSCDDEGKR